MCAHVCGMRMRKCDREAGKKTEIGREDTHTLEEVLCIISYIESLSLIVGGQQIISTYENQKVRI